MVEGFWIVQFEGVQGQFKNEPFTTGYPSHSSELGEGAFMRGDVQEICDFLQQVHLGIESIHESRRARREGQKKKPAQVTPVQASKGTKCESVE